MGRCKNCGSGDLIIRDDSTYTCKDCGYIGNVREWITKFINKFK